MKVTPDLCVANIEKSVEFYRDVLGFEVTDEHKGEDGTLMHAGVRRGDADVMFDRLDWLSEEDQKAKLGVGTGLYFELGDADIDAYYNGIREKGGTVIQEIADQFWGHRHFQITDLDGYRLSFAKPIGH